MSVPIKNATALVTVVGQTPEGDLDFASNPHKTTVPVVVDGYYEEMTPGEMFQRQAVALTDPAVFQCEIADAVHFPPDAEVLVGGRVYRVHGKAAVYRAGTDADHAEINLELKNHPLNQ